MPGGVYRGMRCFWAEESILKVRKVKVEASVMRLEGDGSTGTVWILEKELGREE